MTFSSTNSNASWLAHASTSRAISMKRCDCAGSSSAVTRFASELSSAINHLLSCAMNGSSTLLVLRGGCFIEGKIPEVVDICVGPSIPAVPGEVMRVDLNINDAFPLALQIYDALSAQITPFIEGSGKIATRQTPEGMIVILTDDWRKPSNHRITTSSAGDPQ